MYPKFIIQGNSLILSKVTYHKELLDGSEQIKGGGRFRFNKDENSFTFYGDSFDFGQAKFDDIKACVEAGHVYSNKFKTHSIADEHKFYYDTGTERIELKPNILPSPHDLPPN